MGGGHKKAKVHRTPPEYMIMKYNAYMVSQMVEDCTMEDFDNAQCQRKIIEEELEYMQELLQQLKEAQRDDKNVGIVPSTS
jgi:hypothetical protein